jgi:SAM-dependent methyltransferase
LNPIECVHSRYFYRRRVQVLADHLTGFLPEKATFLDVGCGDGLLTHIILNRRKDTDAQGIDVLLRENARIKITQFNGEVIPYPPKSFDVVMFVDVLHHTENPLTLLQEAIRVARRRILIKDHTLKGFLADPILRFMDRIGNARHRVSLPYNYWTESRWRDTFQNLGLKVVRWKSELNLYPPPAHWLFDRSLHFIVELELDADTPFNDLKQTSQK